MKATVDQNLCIGCGLCTSIASDVFALNDEGKSEVVGEVTGANEEAAREAADSCPVDAIAVLAA